jgi:hypothetical protein
MIRHGPHTKRHIQQLVFRCRGNVFTELFPSNDMGIHIYAAYNSSGGACLRCYGNQFIEPLSNNERRDTLYRTFA